MQFDWTKEQPIKIECVVNDFKDVNKFFLSTKNRLKSFNEYSFQGEEMKRSATSEKYKSITYCIEQYAINYPRGVDHLYNNNIFFILYTGHSFHLSALEATLVKTLHLNLCRKKEFIYSLKILHTILISCFLVHLNLSFFNDTYCYINSIWLDFTHSNDLP